MAVQVEWHFDLHRFSFAHGKEAGIMPEQSAHRQEEIDPDQQTHYHKKLKGEAYENHRQDHTGRIQCRN